MKRILSVLALAGALISTQSITAQAASIVANVSLSTQTMTVSHRGKVLYNWKVSTAAGKKVTPTGSWSAKFLSKNHRSSRYNNAPMPYAIFYNGNFAVHGTDQVGKLGRPASKGCVRLHPANAAKLFAMVQREGVKNMRVNVRR